MAKKIKSTRYVTESGTQIWSANIGGTWLTHRTDGPAVIHTDGTQEWYHRNKCHRKNGPAIVRPNGKVEWHWRDKQLPFDMFVKRAKWSDEQITEWKLMHG